MLHRPPTLPITPRRVALACALMAALLAPGANAAPVDGSTELDQPDPYELALRWTLAGLSPVVPPHATAPVATRPQFSALPRAAGDAGVPAPGAYALMGLGLLGAGLAARYLGRTRGRGAQRGSARKP